MTDDRALQELIASERHGVLATIRPNGYPQLSNVLYVWDADRQTARISTMAPRLKARNLVRDPHAALHVGGSHFWSYAVAEGTAALSDVSTVPGDAAGRELLEVHRVFYGDLEEDDFFAKMVAQQRVVIRLRVERLYGVTMERPPGG